MLETVGPFLDGQQINRRRELVQLAAWNGQQVKRQLGCVQAPPPLALIPGHDLIQLEKKHAQSSVQITRCVQVEPAGLPLQGGPAGLQLQIAASLE